MKKLYSILVFAENKPGVLEKISMLIRRKMYNVEQITASGTEKEGITRITISFSYEDIIKIPQILNQINKIVEVIEVRDIENSRSVKREVGLIKIGKEKNMSDLFSLIQIFKGHILNVTKESIIVEIIGDNQKIDDFISVLDGLEILEIGRTGTIAMER